MLSEKTTNNTDIYNKMSSDMSDTEQKMIKKEKKKKIYKCEKCLTQFDKKDSYTKHMNRKISCIDSDKNVNEEIKELKTEVKKLKKSKMISTNEELQEHFHKIHNLYRSKEGMSELEAMKEIMILFSIKLFEPLIRKGIIDLPNDCCFTELTKETDEAILYSKVMREVIPKFYKNELTKEYFDKPKIQKPSTVFKTFEYLDEIDYAELNEDLVGKLYEYFIGRQKGTNQGFGQYFTNRTIIELFLDKCEEEGILELDENGLIPSFCDPTCGTGGFLVCYVNRMIHKFPKLDWSKQQKQVYGYDISPMLLTSARLNLLVLTGVIFENLHQLDTMMNNIKDGYDICCGNPPFGGDTGDNINYNELPDNLDIKKKINIPVTKKAYIFSQLFIAKAKKIGGIVLPEGFFFGSDNNLIKLREKMMTEKNVRYVIDIPQDAFDNTSTKTCTVIFRGDKSKTKKISFIDLITKKVIVEPNIEKIKEKKYSLNYQRYIEQKWNTDSNYKLYKIKDICKLNPSNITKDDSFENIKYIDLSSIDKGKVRNIETIKLKDAPSRAKRKVKVNDILIGTVRPIHQNNTIITEDIMSKNLIVSTGFCVLRANIAIVNPKYLFYILMTDTMRDYMNNKAIGSSYPAINTEIIEDIKIPLPDLAKQTEIVEEIETYDNCLIHGEKMVKLMEKALICEVKNVIRNEQCKREKIKNFCKFLGKSKRKAGEGKDVGEYPFYICSNTKNKWLDEADYNEETIVIGTGGNPAINISDKFSCSTDNILLRANDDKYNWWIYYVICGNMNILENGFEGTTIKHITKGYVEEIELPLPNITTITKLKTQYVAIKHHKELNRYYKNIVKNLVQKLSEHEATKNEKNSTLDCDDNDDIIFDNEVVEMKTKKNKKLVMIALL